MTMLERPVDERLLADFQARWGEALAALHRSLPPPWWRPRLVITPELRERYEWWLPIAAFCQDLNWLLGHWLPGPGWLPYDVRTTAYASLPDLWRVLPDQLAGRIDWRADELLPLACGLASPYRFGSQSGRYPEQRDLLAKAPLPRTPLPRTPLPRTPLVVELGCGTGQGTWELAGWLPEGSRVLGVTREPLEAWMARQRRLPHAPQPAADWAFPPAPANRDVSFLAGDARSFRLTRAADLVVCNGLIGGPAMAEETALRSLARQLARLLRPGGRLLIGNRFHGGYAAGQERFAELAVDLFRWCASDAQSLLLRRL